MAPKAIGRVCYGRQGGVSPHYEALAHLSLGSASKTAFSRTHVQLTQVDRMLDRCRHATQAHERKYRWKLDVIGWIRMGRIIRYPNVKMCSPGDKKNQSQDT